MAPSREIPEGGGPGLGTWFASARRAEHEELVRQIDVITRSPVINAMLVSVSGLLAILNDDRQTLAVNDTFLAMLGIDTPAAVLGLRPGEALHCAHADDNPAGCGTGEFCSTCGAAIAIVTSLATNSPEERKCILTAETSQGTEDLCFEVKASPLIIGESRFVLLFLRDISEQERRSALAKTFFHDIRNMVMGLGCTIELMGEKSLTDSPRLHDKIRRLADNLAREVKIQGSLTNAAYNDIPITPTTESVIQVVQDLHDMVVCHPATSGKRLTIDETLPPDSFVTDRYLLLRVLSNMVINAFEATEEGEEVKLWVAPKGDTLDFRVWNRGAIPRGTALRIFQLYFSTREEPGRGMGTFSMKLIGEKMLGGSVTFTTSESDGTLFSFVLPKNGRP